MDLHDWVCVSPGEYDSTYKCKRCGDSWTESIDNPDTALPRHGCVESALLAGYAPGDLDHRYAGHGSGVVIKNDGYGNFSERPMTTPELIARNYAAKIQDDIYKHANFAGMCYHPIWELIAEACGKAIEADKSGAY